MAGKAASVEEYLAGVPSDERVALEGLRAVIREVIPNATEVISYQVPTFKHKGRGVVAYAAFKHHCSLFVMSKAVADSHARALAGYDTSKGTIRFTVDKPLPDALVKKLVAARIKENEAKVKRK